VKVVFGRLTEKREKGEERGGGGAREEGGEARVWKGLKRGGG
jgi:hypothetical protein